jgi:hypothetical protein
MEVLFRRLCLHVQLILRERKSTQAGRPGLRGYMALKQVQCKLAGVSSVRLGSQYSVPRTFLHVGFIAEPLAAHQGVCNTRRLP